MILWSRSLLLVRHEWPFRSWVFNFLPGFIQRNGQLVRWICWLYLLELKRLFYINCKIELFVWMRIFKTLIGRAIGLYAFIFLIIGVILGQWEKWLIELAVWRIHTYALFIFLNCRSVWVFIKHFIFKVDKLKTIHAILSFII